MGGGSWTTDSYKTYAHSRGFVTTTASACLDSGTTATVDALCSSVSNQEIFTSRHLHELLNPKNVIRECCDSEEHPNTIPVILGIDVTGSMGQAAVEVAKTLNIIMTKLYDQVEDIQFMVMGIGDLDCDRCPIQATQFESDIRIMEQLDKVYFEFGGGGNTYESYTAAWYFGSRHTKLDCWKRGKKGIIITMGDERLNPYLPIKARYGGLSKVTGDDLQADIETKDLYAEASEKFDIYHLDVDHRYRFDENGIENSWKAYLDEDHFKVVTLNDIADTIAEIIIKAVKENKTDLSSDVHVNENGEISW